MSGIAVLVPSCVVRPGPHGPVVSIAPGAVGVTEVLPPGYAAPYYFYGRRYYYGGRWEPGRFRYHGRYYDGRYVHNGRYFYGGHFHAGGPGPHPHHR